MINKPRILVNNDFRMAILIDDDNTLTQEPPFLNRFEKHLISFDNLLTQQEKKLGDFIINLIEKMTSFNNSQHKSFINISNQKLNCHKEEIYGLIYMLCKNGKEEKNTILAKIIEIIVKTFSQDLILFAQFSNQIDEPLLKNINSNYHQNNFTNINEYLRNINKIKKRKNIIYTFSRIHENIKLYIEDIICPFIKGKINEKTIYENFVSKFQSQSMVENLIMKFYGLSSKKTLKN